MEDGKYLTFDLAGRGYAVNISCVNTIVNGCGDISPVPDFPDYSRGIINLRGDIVPIIDVRRRLRMPDAEDLSKCCIIVTDSQGKVDSKFIGLVVDKVNSVVDYSGDNFSNVPKITSSGSEYLKSIYKAENGIVMILEPVKLLTEVMTEAIDRYMSSAGGPSED